MNVVQQNGTFLSLELHYHVALLLMNTYSTHISSKQIQYLFTDGHTQARVPDIFVIIVHA